MNRTLQAAACCALAALVLAACGQRTALPPSATEGPDPQLVDPVHGLVPPIKIARPIGWQENQTPQAAADLKATAFARGLEHPRWLYVLPNGDVLVAESNGKPEPVKRPKDLVMRMVLKAAGAGVPSPNRITLLRDADGDGVAEFRSVFLSGLNSPFGMTLVGRDLYVANTDAVVRYPYNGGETRITAAPVKVLDLPAGRINHHWTKNVIASRDGTRLYVTVGSNSNVGENGMDVEVGRAAIWEVDRATGRSRIFASGLRNPNGMDFEPQTGVLWTVANERDEVGDDLAPDYLTSVRDGGFYGWPYSYWGRHVDTRVEPQRPDLVARAITPDYALGAHTGSLGLVFYTGSALPARYRGGAFIGQHGSWNRSELSGYRVLFVPFRGGRPSGQPLVAVGGFVTPEGQARGRPVGVVVDRTGALLVADDAGNVVWRVTAAAPATRAAG